MFNTKFDISYDLNDNLVTLTQLVNFDKARFSIISNADLTVGKLRDKPVQKDLIHSMNGIMRIGQTSYVITKDAPYVAYIDLHTNWKFVYHEFLVGEL